MGKTLLLADDSVTIQKVVGISFANEDIEIATVDNGNDAVTRARELRPDIVLADVVMPGQSGYEVCEAIKADPALAHIPVVLLTGTFEAFDAERAERAGAAGHVSKPFEAQTLVDRVKELLAQAPAPAPPAAAPEPPQVAPAAMASAPVAPPAAPVESAPAGVPPVPSTATAFEFTDDGEDFGTPPLQDADFETQPEPLEFDESDAAFSFEEDDLANALLTPEVGAAAAPPPDATQLMPPPVPAADAPVEPADLAQTALLDPAGASSFDVSSSDLGPPPPWPDPAQAKSAPEAEMPPPAGEATEAVRPYGAVPVPEPAAPPQEAVEPAAIPPAAVPPAAELPMPDVSVSPSPAPEAAPQAAEPAWQPAAATAGSAGSGAGPQLGDPVEPAAASLPGDDAWTPATAAEPAEIAAPSPEDFSAQAEPETPASPDPNLDWLSEPAPEVASGWEAGSESDEPAAVSLEPAADLEAPSAPEMPAWSAEAGGASEPDPAPATEWAGASSEPAALTPELQRELSDTLEKIAWDAFGPVTEKIVTQALERIEQVVWEVVPQIAETLIQEEIRRLKEGGDD